MFRKFLRKNIGFIITSILVVVILIVLARSVLEWVANKTTKEDTTVAEIVEEETSTEEVATEEITSETQEEVFETLTAGSKTETTDVTTGIDVAKYQGIIDWQQVRDAGYQFAMIRVGYRLSDSGDICEDPLAKYNMQQAQAAGIQIGVYFFSTAISEEEAVEEAAWVCNYIAQYAITYPVVYNCEGFQEVGARHGELTKTERTDNAVAFLNYIYNQGYIPMFYAAKNEMTGNAKWDTDTLDVRYKIWVSQYPEAPYPETAQTDYTGAYAMWQYTDSGTVSGIDKGVDIDIANFGYSETAVPHDSTIPELVEADPAALINFTDVNETITAKSETNIRSTPSQTDDSNVVVKLYNGDTVIRTGVGDNGWSRLSYNGKDVYAVSSLLTTDLNGQSTDTAAEALATDTSQPTDTATSAGATTGSKATYTEVNEQVTPKMETNLRTEPSTINDATIVATIKNGEYVTRIGVGSNGWSKIDYNGQTVYAVTSYLAMAQ